MAGYRKGFWRISMVLSVLGLFWGLHWSSQEWPRIEEHRRFVESFERKVQALPLSAAASTIPTVVDLGRKVKAKYPEYADLPDAEVGRRVKAKFPGAYDDFVDVVSPSAWSDLGSQEEVSRPPRIVDVPEIGLVEFPGSMTGPQIREAILRFVAVTHRVVKPAWYWYASLIAVPLFASLAPLALYRVVRWVAEGFMHAGK